MVVHELSLSSETCFVSDTNQAKRILLVSIMYAIFMLLMYAGCNPPAYLSEDIMYHVIDDMTSFENVQMYF